MKPTSTSFGSSAFPCKFGHMSLRASRLACKFAAGNAINGSSKALSIKYTVNQWPDCVRCSCRADISAGPNHVGPPLHPCPWPPSAMLATQSAPLFMLIIRLLLLSTIQAIASQAQSQRFATRILSQAGATEQARSISNVSRSALDPRLPALHRLWAAREALLATQHHHPENLPFTYLALCVVVRDEPRLLYEWIMYHYKVMKVQRFYVYDNNSTTTLLPTLLPLVRQGVLVYEYFSFANGLQGGPYPQKYAYEQCMLRWRAHHEWMGFIDVDEFLVLRPPLPGPAPPSAASDIRKLQPRPKSPLEMLLSEYEGAGGLAVNWAMFSSDGYDATPPGILGYYNTCMHSHHVKTIASTHFWVSTQGNPHNHRYRDGAVTVDERGAVVTAHNNTGEPSRLLIFHYSLRSKQHHMQKIRTTDAWQRNSKDMDYFHRYNNLINATFHQAHPRCDDVHVFKDCFTLNSTKNCSAHV